MDQEQTGQHGRRKDEEEGQHQKKERQRIGAGKQRASHTPTGTGGPGIPASGGEPTEEGPPVTGDEGPA